MPSSRSPAEPGLKPRGYRASLRRTRRQWGGGAPTQAGGTLRCGSCLQAQRPKSCSSGAPRHCCPLLLSDNGPSAGPWAQCSAYAATAATAADKGPGSRSGLRVPDGGRLWLYTPAAERRGSCSPGAGCFRLTAASAPASGRFTSQQIEGVRATPRVAHSHPPQHSPSLHRVLVSIHHSTHAYLDS